MRLSDHDIAHIKQAILACDSRAQVYVFGSRVDDDLKGGDIDVLIESDKITRSDIVDINLKLMDALGEQKIDVLLRSDTEPTFLAIIDEQKVLL